MIQGDIRSSDIRRVCTMTKSVKLRLSTENMEEEEEVMEVS